MQPLAFVESHIDPVRSMITTTSNGFVPHGWQAVLGTLKLNRLRPTTFANVVGMVPVLRRR